MSIFTSVKLFSISDHVLISKPIKYTKTSLLNNILLVAMVLIWTIPLKSNHLDLKLSKHENEYFVSVMSKDKINDIKITDNISTSLSLLPPNGCPSGPKLVISQVYGGGGNSGAVYTHDFIEIFNAGLESADLSGMSVQYASSTGSTWQVTAISGALQPGQYYLIQQAAGAGGTTPLPTPDAIGSIAMAGSNGKVALVSSTTALTGSCPLGTGVIDFVGYGSANCFEGTGATPALSNTTAALRAGNGCIDTDDNSDDFTAVAPIPRNTASPFNNCYSVPEIIIVDNECPSTQGSISATGCDGVYEVVEWALNENGPWSETAPDYTSISFTVYARCKDIETGCAGPIVSATTNPEICESDCPSGPKLVISQVYGGGGNSGAVYTHDFIEIFNAGLESADLSGMSVQYASSTGTTWQVTNISGTLQPGQYYLIQQAAGAGGTTPLPTPDAIGSIAMAGSNGKVALVSSTTALTGTCPLGTGVIDFVGYGSANCFEGTGATPALSNTTAALRADNGCIDSDDNSYDFTAVAPVPRNTAAPFYYCYSVPEILIVDNECPSTQGSISATGCDGVYEVVEWALDENGPWSETAPDYTSISFTVYARCNDIETGCTGPIVSATTNPEICESDCPSGPKLVISQVYGGGGNSGAPYTHDYIEIFNAGIDPVSLNGLSLQYASATGTGNFGSTANQITVLPDVIVNPGQYYLIQLAGGANGVALPTPDHIDPAPINLAGASGKVIIANTTVSLGCNGGSNPCDQTQLDLIIDLVGYGTANFYEGTGAAPGLSNTTAGFRADGGCIDTDDNAADFTADAPAPRNSGSPFNYCYTVPEILIVNNECPSTVGSLSASGCEQGEIVEWALDINGPWSDTAPDYTEEPLTVFARCIDLTTGCAGPAVSATTDPEDCNPCEIISIVVSNISACDDNGTPADSDDDFFTATVAVTYANRPSSGTLDLTGDATASIEASFIGTVSHTFGGVVMSADGGPISLTASFSAKPSCTLTNENAGTAPESCSFEPRIANYGGPTIEDPCTCAGNGLFDEEIVISSGTGQIWLLSANTGFLNPLTGMDYPIGTSFTETSPGSGEYTLVGQHVDGIGYSLSASFGNYTLSISNSCDYPPVPEVEDITVCEGEPTIIAPEIPEMQDAISAEVFYDFNLPAPDVLIAQNSDPTVMIGGDALYGPGLTGATTFAGCGSDPGQAMAATHWTELTEEDAVVAGDYFEFPVSNAHADNTLLITGFSFDARRSGTGPLSWAVYNGTEPTGFSGVLDNANTCISNSSEDLSIILSPGASASMRIYAWSASGTGGTLRVDNVTIGGESSPQIYVYKFYDTDPALDPNAEPVFEGYEYNSGTTSETSPETIWVTGNFAFTLCESEAVTVVVTVYPLPVLECPQAIISCNTAEPFLLNEATPAGGIYSGPGVDSGVFDPAVAGIGAHAITYIYTDDITGCTNECTFNIEVINCDFDFIPTDPCLCNNDQSANDAQDGTFDELVSVSVTQSWHTWTVVAVNSLAPGGAMPSGIAIGDQFIFNAANNSHEFSFQHVDDSGYEIIIEGPGSLIGTIGNPFRGNVQLTTSNVCQYPVVSFSPALIYNYCLGDPAFNLGLIEENGFTGVATYTIGGTAVTQINPATLGPGTYTVSAVFDGNFADNISADPDNPAFPGCETSISHTFTIVPPALLCPGDMLITLPPGECCWPAAYWARTIGCPPQSQEIQFAPLSVEGFAGSFDPSGFPEYDPNTQPFPPDFTQPFTLNGPASTYGPSVIYLHDLPDFLYMENFDSSPACGGWGNGTGAWWNYTLVNFIAPFDGDLSFDWHYTTTDGAFWDRFVYMINGVWNPLPVNNWFGPQTQSGTFTINLAAGAHFTIGLWDLDFFGCGGDVTLSNLLFGEPAIKDGIVWVSGPQPGEDVCHGETETVTLHLLYDGDVIDSCSFDITVQEWQNPTKTLSCNDLVLISVDEECNAYIGADMILEGGPYACYDNYAVEIFTQMPANTWNAKGNVANPAQPGSYWVGIYDDSGNNCWSYVTVVDKIPPTIECYCPVGGAYPAGSVIPSAITGTFTSNDKSANIRQTCWNFGNMNITPDFGNHYYHQYVIQADITGDYTITGGDGNKMIIGVFNQPFNPAFPCAGMVGGTGGWVVDAKGKGLYSQPGGFGMNPAIQMMAGQCYYIIVTDFDAEYTGNYSMSISGPGELTFCQAVYDAECQFAGCYEPGIDYAFPLPEVFENCPAWDLTWTETLHSGPDCGTMILRRVYTVTDAAGMEASCTSEYLFTGVDLANLEWPANWDDLPNNNPMLLCNENFPLDWNGNPHPNYTGWPGGWNETCETIEVFYHDQVYTSPPWGSPDCGIKILREWTVVDDCTGAVLKHIQIIRITDKNAPVFELPAPVIARSKSHICESDIAVPAIIHLEDDCDTNPKWWVTTNAGVITGDINNNGFVDPGEIWVINGVPMGEYTLCYHAIDNCGNERSECIDIRVIDGIPPIPVCEQYKTVSLTHAGTAMIHAEDFDSGSFDNCGPVWFKVLRVNDQFVYDNGCRSLNINKGGEIPSNTSWFDDEVFFCCDDVDNEVMVTLRVFDVNPGPGPVAPGRMLPGGDLYGHWNDCWNITKVECKIPPLLYCPPVTITCEDNIDPYENPALYPEIVGLCGYDATYTDGPKSDICSGAFNRTWVVEACGRTTQCIQRITIENTTPFDPCTIQFPADVTTQCNIEPSSTGRPTWHEYPCNIITAEIVKEDTFWFVEDACMKILREWAVIDWCVYGELSLTERTAARMNTDPITAARRINCTSPVFIEDGYYRYTQVLKMEDKIAPTIDAPDVCVETIDCYAYNVKLTATADDICNPNDEFWWKYIITDMSTWDIVQYSYSYEPRPDQGRRGTQTEERTKLSKVKTAELTVLNPLPIGTYKVMWTSGDGCGNATTVTQIVRVVDNKAPTPVLVNLATAAMDGCMVEICAKMFDKGGCPYDCISSFDNCTEPDDLYFTFTDVLPKLHINPTQWQNQYNKYGKFFFDPLTGLISTEANYLFGEAHAWDPVNRTSCRIIGIDRFGNAPYPIQVLKIYVWDQFAENDDCDGNNYDWGEVVLSINMDHEDCPKPGSLVNGFVNNCIFETGINDVNIVFDNGFESSIRKSRDEGQFNIGLPEGDYNITANKTIDGIPGMTTLDLVIIQKHILGIKPESDICRLAAMDINNDGRISAADILTGRKKLLGYSDPVSNYNFLSEEYISENSGNPNISLSDAYRINMGVEKGKTYENVNFSGVLAGDVNFSAGNIEPRSANSVRLIIDELELFKGETYEIPVYLSETENISGIQFELISRGFVVKSIESHVMNINTTNYRIDGSSLRFIWIAQPEAELDHSKPVMTIVIEANETRYINNSLTLVSGKLTPEVYSGFEISDLELEFRNTVGSFALHQNIPNPFSAKTVIGFDLPEAGYYILNIYDVTGKVVKEISKYGKYGYNSIEISRNDLNTSGVFYYRLKSGENTDTRKMILIE